MAESTNSLTFLQLKQEVGYFAGFTRIDTNWSAAQKSLIEFIVQQGIKRFYFPPPTIRNGKPHEWSFLKPVNSISVFGDIDEGTATVTGVHSAGTTTITASIASFYESMVGMTLVIAAIGSYEITGYTSSTVISVSGSATCSGKKFSLTTTSNFRLPDNFGGMEGDLTFNPDEGWTPVKIVSEAQIRKRRQVDGVTGRPQIAAIRPVSAPATGQRFELMVWPEPDDVYVLSYKMTTLMNQLTDTQYPLGGMAHSETILESCLAAAELKLKDLAEGPHWVAFLRALEGSVALDGRANTPEYLGYNGDPDMMPQSRLSRTTEVSYNGTVYGED